LPVLAVLVSTLALAHTPAATPYCVREAGWIADNTLQVLHHYDHDIYPADVALIKLNASIKQYRLHRCPAAPVRQAMLHRLTRAQRTRLLEILPNDLVRWFRAVLAS
jgi:hypothetical protein